MKSKIKIITILSSIFLVILAIHIIKIIKNSDKKMVDLEIENQVEEPTQNQESLKKVNVTGYHLVTYAQSANNHSLLKTLDIRMEEDAKVKFIIGTIDDKNLVQERTRFEVNCKKGENTFDLLADRHFLKEGEYLFMDIAGQDILYEQEAKAKSLVQNESNKLAGKMMITESDYVLPFKYTLEKVEKYNVYVIGNDITTKDGIKGLAATDEKHDYYYLTKSRLENTFEKVNMDRINAGDWEKNKLISTHEDWINKNLTQDKLKNLDLVIFQLGDDFQTEEDFETSVIQMVEHFRKYSPNAEMIWVGTWNINEKIRIQLPGICERLGIEFVNISDLNIPEYQSLMTQQENLEEVFYPNNEAMQIISNRIIEVLNFDFEEGKAQDEQI